MGAELDMQTGFMGGFRIRIELVSKVCRLQEDAAPVCTTVCVIQIESQLLELASVNNPQ